MDYYQFLPFAGTSNTFCQLINPSCCRRMQFFLPWMIGTDSKSEPETVETVSQIFLLCPISIWAQHIALLMLPRCLNIVTSPEKYDSLFPALLFLSVSFLSVSLPPVFRDIFYTVLWCSHLKVSDFYKTIKDKTGSIWLLMWVFSHLNEWLRYLDGQDWLENRLELMPLVGTVDTISFPGG